MITRIISLVFLAGSAVAVEPGPLHPPTSGAIWPFPQSLGLSDNYYTFDPNIFKFKIAGENCAIVSRAVSRYTVILQKNVIISQKYGGSGAGHYEFNVFDFYSRSYMGVIRELIIKLTKPCEALPHFGMNETYSLTVAQSSLLTSSSVWGILRGLESFSQLFYLSDDYKEVRINTTQVVDFPRYPHRGLLMDTSRHYVPLQLILGTLDAMAMNKMNVFHWHIVDDQSFPFVSEKFPDLSFKGAYHPSMVYTKRMVATVVTYARDRGIRVIPEFDVPGHTRSWGQAYPNILTACYHELNNSFAGYGPLNPIQNVTYKLLRDLYAEVQRRFPDEFFHMGGDEVNLKCWESNPDLQKYMQEHSISVADLHALFMSRVIPLLRQRVPIVWQEVFEEGVTITKDALVQVWKPGGTDFMVNTVRSGFRVIYSSKWYLDHLEETFSSMYSYDPRQKVLEKTRCEKLAQMVVGGEACLWGEMIDETNLISRTWPRTSAVAEVLWSAAPPMNLSISTEYLYHPSENTFRRIEEHVCRMRRRHIPVEPPSGPGYCLA